METCTRGRSRPRGSGVGGRESEQAVQHSRSSTTPDTRHPTPEYAASSARVTLTTVSNLLVVDVGNTNIVLGVFRGDSLVSSWRLATARERTSDEYGILARQLIGEAFADAFDGAIVSSVVPPLNHSIASMVRKF